MTTSYPELKMILAVKPSLEDNSVYIIVPVDDTNEKSLGIVVTPSKKSWRRINERNGKYSTSYHWYNVGEKGVPQIGVVLGVFDDSNPLHVEEMNKLLGRDPAQLSFASA